MSIFTFVSRVEIFIKHNDLQFIHLFSELIYLVSATQQRTSIESRGSGIGTVEKNILDLLASTDKRFLRDFYLDEAYGFQVLETGLGPPTFFL